MDALCTSSSVESAERAAYAIVTACAAMKEALSLTRSNTEFMQVWRIVRESRIELDRLGSYAGGEADEKEF